MVRQQVATAPTVSQAATVAELLAARAWADPDRVGYVFLADGETDERAMSYAECDRSARSVALTLRAAGLTPGERALIVMAPGLDYVVGLFGCLYAGVLAVPVYPPDPHQPARSVARLAAVVHDCAPSAVLTTDSLLGFLDQLSRPLPGFAALPRIAVDRVLDAGVDESGLLARSATETALLQYTSGSTADPRGVMVTHANLLHNSAFIHRVFGTGPESAAVVWLPPYHDMGLIGGLLQPLYGGFPVTLMSPLHFLQDPTRWLRAISRQGATASGGPDFAYDLCSRHATAEDVAGLDLRSWSVAFNGAEPIRPETLERFARTFEPAGFRADAFLPCFGLAEATLIVTGGRTNRPHGNGEGLDGAGLDRAGLDGARQALRTVSVDRRRLEQDDVVPVDDEVLVDDVGDLAITRLVGCGRSALDQQVLVVDPLTGLPCRADRVGEVWVSGPSVAAGYWNRPDATERTFRARLGDGSGPFLRTGDLGFWHGDDLVITGRLVDLVIVRGRNHYPHELERTAEAAEQLLRPGGSAAFTIITEPAAGPDAAPAPELVIVLEVRRGTRDLDVTAVAGRVRHLIARDHGLQVRTVVLVEAGEMPKTSSGKVQRRLCRQRLAAGELTEIGRSELSVELPPTTADPRPSVEAREPSEDGGGATNQPPVDNLETRVRSRVAQVVALDPSAVDRDASLLAVGLDSLGVVRLQHTLRTDLGVTVPLDRLLSGASLADLVADVSLALEAEAGHPAPASDSPAPIIDQPLSPSKSDGSSAEIAPMSYGQRWVWFLQHAEPTSAAFTIATALRLPGTFDETALRQALDTLVARHPVLRTTFPVRDGVAVQLIRGSGRADYRTHKTHGIDDATLVQVLSRAARKPLDLERGPLLRLDLYRGAGDPVLLVVMHHIITDFWSATILAREFSTAYDACRAGQQPDLPARGAGFADVVRAQQALEGTPREARLIAYWDDVVAAGLPRLSLPAPDDPSRPGGSRSFALSPELSRRLRQRAETARVTPYVFLLAGFAATLLQAGGSSSLVIGANAAARTDPEFDNVVGLCTNPVLVRADLAPSDTFRDLLTRTQRSVIGALEHQEYPVMLLAGRQQQRGGRLFDVLFSYNRALDAADDLAAAALVAPIGTRHSLGALDVELVPLPAEPSRLPVELVMAEVDGSAHGLLRYRGDVLDDAVAQRLVTRFVDLLDAVLADPNQPLGVDQGR